MVLSKVFKNQRVLYPLEVATLLVVALIATHQESAASTDAVWSRQPSWTNDSSSSASRKSSNFDARNQLSPFAPGSNNLALDLGQVFLMGDHGSKYGDSIGARLHYTYGVSDLFGFDSSLGYSEHSEGEYSMTSLLTGLRTNLSWYDKVVPYVVFGLGFYKPSLKYMKADATESTYSPVLFGVHLGPGIDLEITRSIFFGAALTFHDAFGATKQTSNGPIEVGGTFTTFLVHAGVSF